MSAFQIRRTGVPLDPPRTRPDRRHDRAGQRPLLEPLEGRSLLATLDIAFSPFAPNALTYTGSGVANDLTITVGNVGGVRSYTFTDSSDTITLGPGAIGFGWTTSLDLHTATGPASSVASIAVAPSTSSPSAGPTVTPATITIDATDAPVTITPPVVVPAPPLVETVNVGTGNLQTIAGSVTVAQSLTTTGLTALTVNDSADPTAKQATLAFAGGAIGVPPGSITGMAPQQIFFDPAQLGALTVDGGSGGNTLTVDYSGGNPIPTGASGLVYNGGSAGDTLVRQGGFDSFLAVSLDGPGAGTINPGGSRIGFTGVKSVFDLVPASSGLTLSTSINSQSLALINGPIFSGVATDQLTSTLNPAGFPQFNFANKGPDVVIEAGVGASTPAAQDVTINYTTAAAGLSLLDLVLGDGDNHVNLIAQPGGITTTESLGNGNNTMAVAAAGLLNTLGTTVHGGTGTLAMTYNANGLVANVNAVSVSAGTGSTAQQTNVTFDHMSQLRIVNTPDLPLSTTAETINTVLGTPFSGATVAAFTYPATYAVAGDFNASIAWGDGTTTPADAINGNATSGFNVLGSHSYAAAGTYPVVVTITHTGSSFVQRSATGGFTVLLPGGSTAPVNSTAVVAPQVVVTGLSISTTTGSPFSGPVATFTTELPRATPSSFTAMIDWADGTAPTPGTITQPGGPGTPFVVSGTHTYNAPGTYSFTVLITAPDQRTVSAQGNATVAPLHVSTFNGIPFNAIEGQPFTNAVASFSVATQLVSRAAAVNPGAAITVNYTALISWGDGSANSAGTVIQVTPGFPNYLVLGTHTYDKYGTYNVAIALFTNGDFTALTTTTATVAPDLTVYNTNDDGLGSLRHAIDEVNAGLGSYVPFRIPGHGPFTIAPPSVGLPLITGPAFFDATQEPGYAGKPLVILSGAGLPGDNQDGLTFALGSEGSKVQGLVINGFSGVGIVLQNRGSDTILGNYIGTNADGTSAVPNYQGVLIVGSSNNQVGGNGPGEGNLISGNRSVAIQVLNDQSVSDPAQPYNTDVMAIGPASGNRVIGNRIGTDASGTAALGNQQGIFINDAPDNTIGGSDPADANVISGNRSVGVQVLGANASNTTLIGNAIGLDRTRTQDLPNGSGAFLFASPSNMSMAAIQAGNTFGPNTRFGVQVRPLTDGPTVQSVTPHATTGSQIDSLTILFTNYLDRGRATNPGNYQVVLLGRNLRPTGTIAIGTPVYDGIYRTVTLTFPAPIPGNSTFRLRIVGTSPNGLTDTTGNFLDGNQGLIRVSTGSDDVEFFRDGQPFQPAGSVGFSVVKKPANRLGHLRAARHPRPHPHPHRHGH